MHEMLQGLLSRPDWEAARKLPIAQFPAGSGNGLAASSGASAAACRARTCPVGEGPEHGSVGKG